MVSHTQQNSTNPWASGVSPTAVIVYMENIGFVYPAMSMMVIGSFASYTKTKSVESAV
jgi:hypothetical protein